MPASLNSNLDAALANPTSGTIAAVGARLTSAIAMIKGATKDNQGAEIVAAWYHANPTTCTRVVDFCPASTAGGVGEACVHSDVCAHTPAAHADAIIAPLMPPPTRSQLAARSSLAAQQRQRQRQQQPA